MSLSSRETPILPVKSLAEQRLLHFEELSKNLEEEKIKFLENIDTLIKDKNYPKALRLYCEQMTTFFLMKEYSEFLNLKEWYLDLLKNSGCSDVLVNYHEKMIQLASQVAENLFIDDASYRMKGSVKNSIALRKFIDFFSKTTASEFKILFLQIYLAVYKKAAEACYLLYAKFTEEDTPDIRLYPVILEASIPFLFDKCYTDFFQRNEKQQAKQVAEIFLIIAQEVIDKAGRGFKLEGWESFRDLCKASATCDLPPLIQSRQSIITPAEAKRASYFDLIAQAANEEQELLLAIEMSKAEMPRPLPVKNSAGESKEEAKVISPPVGIVSHPSTIDEENLRLAIEMSEKSNEASKSCPSHPTATSSSSSSSSTGLASFSIYANSTPRTVVGSDASSILLSEEQLLQEVLKRSVMER